jgi:hypothetical protein
VVLWRKTAKQKLFHPNDMMHMTATDKKYLIIFLLMLPFLWPVAGCWQHKPVNISTQNHDSTSNITLCRSYNSETWSMQGTALAFPLFGDDDVRALFDINHLLADGFAQTQIFHIEWLDNENDLLYRKQVDLQPGDSTRWLESSIGVSPQTRSPGNYQVLLYHFREMVALQNFELLPMESIIESWGQQLQPEIILYSKTRRKTGELIGVGHEFEIREKGYVRAQILFKNAVRPATHELRLAVDWLSPDSSSCYRKDIWLYPGDSLTSISSSISIPPNKRSPGNYRLQLWLFDAVVAESEFRLIEKTQKAVSRKK